MAHVYTEPINEEPLAYFTGGAAEVSRPHEVAQVVSHFICHDLRALVRHIFGFIQLLHEKTYAHLDNTNRQHLDTILESGKTISALMDDLLNFARVARFETHKREVGLKPTVEDAPNQLLQIGHDPRVRENNCGLDGRSSKFCPGCTVRDSQKRGGFEADC